MKTRRWLSVWALPTRLLVPHRVHPVLPGWLPALTNGLGSGRRIFAFRSLVKRWCLSSTPCLDLVSFYESHRETTQHSPETFSSTAMACLKDRTQRSLRPSSRCYARLATGYIHLQTGKRVSCTSPSSLLVSTTTPVSIPGCFQSRQPQLQSHVWHCSRSRRHRGAQLGLLPAVAQGIQGTAPPTTMSCWTKSWSSEKPHLQSITSPTCSKSDT